MAPTKEPTLVYNYTEPDVMIPHQIAQHSRMLQMLDHITNLNFSIGALKPLEVAEILAVTEGHIHGPLGDLRRIALLLQSELDKTQEFIRPAYWYERNGKQEAPKC